MPSYEASQFDPPAPIARVVLRNPESGAAVDNELLLLDTGADVTLLSRTAVERLGVPLLTDQRYELMGFDGSKSFASVVVLDLIFLKRVFHGRYLLVDEERESWVGTFSTTWPCYWTVHGSNGPSIRSRRGS